MYIHIVELHDNVLLNDVLIKQHLITLFHVNSVHSQQCCAVSSHDSNTQAKDQAGKSWACCLLWI